MPSDNQRAAPKRRPPRRDLILPQWAVLALFSAMLVFCVAIVIGNKPGLREAGILGALFVLATFPMALRASADSGAPSSRESFDRVSRAIERLGHEGGLSETAKRILHRKQERELLRVAIEQDIADGDYDAAMILVQELADRFGYRVDAEEFRARIERVRAQSRDAAVIQALTGLEELIRKRQWAEAHAEAARITRLFSDSHRVDRLRERVEEARARHKQDLERRFLLSAQRDEVEQAMALLKELDQYLTEAEAEPFREVARGVIGKARDNLGVRFKLAVQDRNWHDALDVGERIIGEFPNSRMAQEVREMIDMLRDRASKTAGVR
ncbi:MAG: hypothetical protein IBJ10_11485 [Phycisphaerales bacterium]|nr:hypothetical protein [Phycisphaerales bacterium]